MSGSESKSEVFTVADAEMGEKPAERDMMTTNKMGTNFEQYLQPCLVELFGTALFIFVGCASVIGNEGAGAIQPALAHGLMLGVLIMVFGPIR